VLDCGTVQQQIQIDWLCLSIHLAGGKSKQMITTLLGFLAVTVLSCGIRHFVRRGLRERR